jgi:outer membrane protein
VKTRILFKNVLAIFILAFAFQMELSAQESVPISLNSAIDLALQNNHLLNIRRLQLEEKQQVVDEDKVKYLPTVIVGGSYQYNTHLPQLVMKQGQFGSIPIGGVSIPMPLVDEVVVLGNNNLYSAGVTLYQPITQLGKIKAGVNVSKTELQMAQTEENKAVFQIKQSVEKLYFGLLIIRKQIEEAEIKIKLAESRLLDVENAILAGKTTESNKYGLAASAADEEQNLLKLRIQYDDYAADLKQLTGLTSTGDLILEPVITEELVEKPAVIDTSLNEAITKNNDLRLATLNKTRAEYSIQASKLSYLPDLGLLGSYTYQDGNYIYPKNNTFVGASLKWNLQDILSNRNTQEQRMYVVKQAEENLANTKEQVNKEITKSYRKLKLSEELISVAKKVTDYRKEDLRIQNDRRRSGLNLESDLLTAKAAVAKAESDYYAAQLNYRIALTELKILTGNY